MKPSRGTDRSVPTPVWFVVEDGTLFVRSYANSGKVKRMRNNPHVRVTPSDAVGKPHGVTIEGTAIRANGDMEIKISQLLYRKYGLMKMSFDLWGAIKQLDWAVFAIRDLSRSEISSGRAQGLISFT